MLLNPLGIKKTGNVIVEINKTTKLNGNIDIFVFSLFLSAKYKKLKTLETAGTNKPVIELK
jgi:hypothetical protein